MGTLYSLSLVSSEFFLLGLCHIKVKIIIRSGFSSATKNITYTHTHTHNRFTAPWIVSGTTWVSWYQKKHSRTHTYRGHQLSLICFIHLLRSMVSYIKHININIIYCHLLELPSVI